MERSRYICLMTTALVRLGTSLPPNFICPNTATVLQKSLVRIQPADMYENLWLLYNKTAIDKCDASLDPTRRLLLSCNTPMQLKFLPVLFAQFSAEPNGLIFEGGRSYYFIGTSGHKDFKGKPFFGSLSVKTLPDSICPYRTNSKLQ